MLASARLIPLGTIARVLAVSRASVLRWCRQGKFPTPVILPDGRRRWKQAVVMTWISSLEPARQALEGDGPLKLDDPNELQRDILQALLEAGGWIHGADLAARIGGDVNACSGHWTRASRRPMDLELIDTDRAHGYRLRPGATIPT